MATEVPCQCPFCDFGFGTAVSDPKSTSEEALRGTDVECGNCGGEFEVYCLL